MELHIERRTFAGARADTHTHMQRLITAPFGFGSSAGYQTQCLSRGVLELVRDPTSSNSKAQSPSPTHSSNNCFHAWQSQRLGTATAAVSTLPPALGFACSINMTVYDHNDDIL